MYRTGRFFSGSTRRATTCGSSCVSKGAVTSHTVSVRAARRTPELRTAVTTVAIYVSIVRLASCSITLGILCIECR